MKVHAPPNTHEIFEVWAVLSVDDNGEGICGADVNGKWMALVTSEEHLALNVLIPTARALAKSTGRKLKVVKFIAREEIEECLP